ncbi:MAG: alginate export family protein, partial [bacterium]|nr:alginate export family protein [bacterium]
MRKLITIAMNALFLLLIMSVIVSAQTEEKKLDISGQIRMRGETDGKDFNNDTDPSDFTLLRSRLNLKFSYSEKIIAFAQLQDSRTFGEEGTDGATATLASLRNVDLHEGYIQLNHLFFPWLSYKFGRMAIKYDTQRLIGINEWSNIGRSFDGSIVTLSFQKIRIDMLNVTL